jgi:predicted deacylase
MKNVLSVGSIKVESGEKKSGVLKISQRADGSDIFIPLMVVNGSQDGPIFNISGGCHGDEYEGMEAVRRTYRSLDPKKLRGALIGVPVINTMAYEAGQRSTPFDGLNLNRCFPGKPQGFFTERLAYLYFNEVIKKAEYVMDLHGGGNIMALAPMAIYRDTGGPDMARKAEQLVRATGIELIWKGSGGWTGPISLEAQKAGIPAITVEIAGEGRFREEVVVQFVKMIDNVFTSYRMIEGEPQLPKTVRNFEGVFINSVKGGFYQQSVEILQDVHQGDRVATISDYFGNVIEEINSPYDGVVCSKRTFGLIEPGGWTTMIGKIL